jgi:hypothetical protein
MHEQAIYPSLTFPSTCRDSGRYRSGQTGQTVNLLALRLRWFESSPAQTFVKTLMRCSRLVATKRLRRNHPELGDTRHDGQALPGLRK